MKTYTIISGVNGVGKSSLTGVLETSYELGRIVNVDLLAKIFGVDSFEAGRRAIFTIDDSLKNGISFTQETTLSGHKTLKTILRAKENGFFVRMFYIGLDSVDECLRRIENRVSKGGHKISKAEIIRRYNKRFSSLLRVLPHCDEILFFDNHNGFKKVAEFKNGEIYAGEMPNWFCELITKIEQELKYVRVYKDLPFWSR